MAPPLKHLSKFGAAPLVVIGSPKNREERVTPMTIATYCSLDFSRNGAISKELNDSAATEASSETIVLSDHLGARPANLTPEMANWFDSYVRQERTGALDEVERQLAQVDSKAHGGGVFLERELWKARQAELSEKRDAERAEREARQRDYEALEAQRAEVEKLSIRYEQKRNRYNREPVIPNKILYFLALIVLGITDMALNWEHVYDAKIGSPIKSFGISFGIAVGIAVSGHLIGTTLRQAKARFNRANDDLDIWAGWQMFSLAGVLVSTALAAVFWIRAEYFSIAREEIILLGGELPSFYGTIVGSMLTNAIVWVVGAALAFLMHDADPGFPEAKIKLTAAEEKLGSLHRMLNKHLNRRFEQAAAKLKEAVTAAQGREASLAQVAAQNEARRMIERIKAQDAHVLAALARYRSTLVGKTSPESHVFIQPSLLASEPRKQLTPAEYNAIGLELPYA